MSGIVIIGIVGAAALLGIGWLVVHGGSVDSEELIQPTARVETRSCPGCGATYHMAWGSLCPDCSGAD